MRWFPCVAIMAEIEPQQSFSALEFKAAIIVIMFTMFFSLSFFPLYLKANAFVTTKAVLQQRHNCHWRGNQKYIHAITSHNIAGFVFFAVLLVKLAYF